MDEITYTCNSCNMQWEFKDGDIRCYTCGSLANVIIKSTMTTDQIKERYGISLNDDFLKGDNYEYITNAKNKTRDS